ncbi:MAG: DUF2283 domain-containing protein [Candidatus Diapherotrites archaeon]|nr:DUF2283 domain-containing protein [Candidatus Diapherotrites archaeon]
MKAEWVYNKDEDILLLNVKGRKSQYSLVSADDIFVVDMDDKDRVSGLEIFDASEVIGVDLTTAQTEKALEGIKAAELKYNIKGDNLVVGFKLLSIYKEPLQDSIPIPITA